MIFSPFILLGVAIVALCVNSLLDRRAGEAFKRIAQGASETEVRALLGQPDIERPCGNNLWWGGGGDYRGKNDGRCATEVRYEYFLSTWAVGYSADRHVVSKYHYVSE